MKVIVDFGEGKHVVIDIDRLVVKPRDCILVKKLANGTPVVAGIEKATAEKYISCS